MDQISSTIQTIEMSTEHMTHEEKELEELISAVAARIKDMQRGTYAEAGVVLRFWLKQGKEKDSWQGF